MACFSSRKGSRPISATTSLTKVCAETAHGPAHSDVSFVIIADVLSSVRDNAWCGVSVPGHLEDVPGRRMRVNNASSRFGRQEWTCTTSGRSMIVDKKKMQNSLVVCLCRQKHCVTSVLFPQMRACSTGPRSLTGYGRRRVRVAAKILVPQSKAGSTSLPLRTWHRAATDPTGALRGGYARLVTSKRSQVASAIFKGDSALPPRPTPTDALSAFSALCL